MNAETITEEQLTLFATKIEQMRERTIAAVAPSRLDVEDYNQ